MAHPPRVRAARSSRKTPRPKSRENGDGPRARHQPPPGKFMAAMTGGDAPCRAGHGSSLPSSSSFRCLRSTKSWRRAALNTAEAGRQSALNALASTEAALAAANKQLADFKSAQANSDTELQAALQSRQKLEADVRSASTQLGEARQQLAAMEATSRTQEQIEQRRPSCRASARARAEGGERAARGNGTRREGRKGRRRRRRARRRRRRSCRGHGSRKRRKRRLRISPALAPRSRPRKADRRDERRVERGSAAVRGIPRRARDAAQGRPVARRPRGAVGVGGPGCGPRGTPRHRPKSRRDAAAVAGGRRRATSPPRACSCE